MLVIYYMHIHPYLHKLFIQVLISLILYTGIQGDDTEESGF